MNKNMLVSKIKLHGDNYADIAKYINISTQRFSAKINTVSGADFTLNEMRKIKEKYNLTAEEIDDIFFCIICILLRYIKF